MTQYDPAIGQIRSFRDAQRALNSIRDYFTYAQRNSAALQRQASYIPVAGKDYLLPHFLQSHAAGLLITKCDPHKLYLSGSSIEIGGKIYYSPEQLICSGGSFNQELYWINGELFTGVVATVGTDKEYATITEAHNALSGDILLLVYDGLQSINITRENTNMYFKNLGTTTLTNCTFHLSAYKTAIVEGFSAPDLIAFAMPTNDDEDLPSMSIYSKCTFSSVGIGAGGHIPYLTLANCRGMSNSSPTFCIIRIYATWWGGSWLYSNTSRTSIHRCISKYAPTLDYGGYLERDYSLFEKNGYGSNYGNDLITGSLISPMNHYIYVKAPSSGIVLSNADILPSFTPPVWVTELGGYYMNGDHNYRYIGTVPTNEAGNIVESGIIQCYPSAAKMQIELDEHEQDAQYTTFNTMAILSNLGFPGGFYRNAML